MYAEQATFTQNIMGLKKVAAVLFGLASLNIRSI